MTLIAIFLTMIGCGHSSRSGAGHETAAPHLRNEASTDDGHRHEEGAELLDPAVTSEATLHQIFAYADRHSPMLAVARSRRARAQAVETAASPLLPSNPELHGGVGMRRTDVGGGVDFEVGLTQEIEIAGERGARLGAAERFAELTRAEIEQARWLLHCDVHATFHRALLERERTTLARAVVSFQEEVLRVVEQQIAAGETAPLVLRLAQAEVAQARQMVVLSEQGYLGARLELGRLAGWPAATPPTPIGVLDEPRDPPGIAELLAHARQHLPTLIALAAAVREAQAREEAAGREGWPRPSLGVAFQREGNPGPDGNVDIITGTLSLPIPSFQTNQGARAHAAADASIAQAELDAAQAMLESSIAQAHSEVRSAAERVRAYGAEILPRFDENLTLLRRSFELGEIDILALSVGRERFLRIQSDALSAQLDYFVALSNLERLIGIELWHDEHNEHGLTDPQPTALPAAQETNP